MQKTKTQIFYSFYRKALKLDKWRLSGYTMKDNILTAYLFLFNEGYIKINNYDDFINILGNSTQCPCNTEILDSESLQDYAEQTDPDYKEKEKELKKGFYLFSYYSPERKNIMPCNIFIGYEKIKATKLLKDYERFIIKGAKWWDKVNGNTYNSAIIYDTKTKKTYKKPFAYGYDNAYYWDSIDYLKEQRVLPDMRNIDNYYELFKHSCVGYIKKTDCKNFNY